MANFDLEVDSWALIATATSTPLEVVVDLLSAGAARLQVGASLPLDADNGGSVLFKPDVVLSVLKLEAGESLYSKRVDRSTRVRVETTPIEGVAIGGVGASTALDPRISHAEREVYATYGDVVSVFQKAKSVHKFGSGNRTTTKGTVWDHDELDETYVGTNIIDTISSSDAGDDQEVTIQGHTVTGTGADQQFTFVVQTATLDGRNKVTLDTPLARSSRVRNIGDTDLAGDIYVYEDTPITNGVPTDGTKVHLKVAAGTNQTSKAATTFSNTDYAFICAFYGSINKKSNGNADFHFEMRPPGGVFAPAAFFSAGDGTGLSPLPVEPFLIVPKNYDVRVRSVGADNSTPVSAGFNCYLASVQ